MAYEDYTDAYSAEDQDPQPAQSAPARPKPVSLEEYEERVRSKYGIPAKLWKAMSQQESGDDVNAVSSTGVRGKWGMTQATAKQYGYNRDDPFEQAAAAGKHLSTLYQKHAKTLSGDKAWYGAIGEYYGGSNAVDSQGNVSGASVDGVSNPQVHIKRIADRIRQMSDTSLPDQSQPEDYGNGAQIPTPKPIYSSPKTADSPAYEVGEGWPQFNGKGKPYKPGNAEWIKEGQANTDRQMAEQEQAESPIIKPAGTPYPQRGDTVQGKREKKAADLIRAIEGNRQRASALFQQADREPSTTVEIKRDAQGRALPMLDSTNKPITRQQALRAQAEGALDLANRMAEHAQQSFGDLVETGFGKDADPNSTRKWAYAKPRDVMVDLKVGEAKRNARLDRTLKPTPEERQYRDDVEAYRKDYESSGILGKAAQKLSTEYLSLHPNSTPAEREELAKRRAAQGVDDAELFEQPGWIADKASRGGRALLSAIPSAAAGLADLADATYARARSLSGNRLPEADEWSPAAHRLSDTVESSIAPVLRTDPNRNEDFTSKVASGIGSAAGFGLINKVASAARIPGTIATGTAGAGLETDQIAEEARKAGFSREQDPARWDKMMALGAASGASEILGVGKILERWGLKRPFLVRAAEVLEEGGQEALQQYLDNINAAHVGSYDKDRALSKDVLENAVIGHIIGAGTQVADIAAERLNNRAEVKNVARKPLVPLSQLPEGAIRSVAPPGTQTQVTPIGNATQQVQQNRAGVDARSAANAAAITPAPQQPTAPMTPEQIAAAQAGAQPAQPAAPPLFPKAPSTVNASNLSPQEQMLREINGEDKVTPEQQFNELHNRAATLATQSDEALQQQGLSQLRELYKKVVNAPEHIAELQALRSGQQLPDAPYTAAANAIKGQIAQIETARQQAIEAQKQAEQQAKTDQKHQQYIAEAVQQGKIPSPATIQRKLRIGFGAAVRLQDEIKRQLPPPTEPLAPAQPAPQSAPLSIHEDARQVAAQSEQQAAQQFKQSVEAGRLMDAKDALKRQKDSLSAQRRLINQRTPHGQAEYKRLGEQIQAVERRQAELKPHIERAARQQRIENAPTAELPNAASSKPNISSRTSDVRSVAGGQTEPSQPLLRPSAQINPQGGVPALPSGTVDFTRLAEKQAEQQAQAPKGGRKASTDLSPIEYLKRATKGAGIRVSDQGEARRLGAKEAGIVGLTNKNSRYTTHDAQIMLAEGGFSLPDGRSFADDSVTENDVLDFLDNHGKNVAPRGTAEIDKRLAEEEAAHQARQEQEERNGDNSSGKLTARQAAVDAGGVEVEVPVGGQPVSVLHLNSSALKIVQTAVRAVRGVRLNTETEIGGANINADYADKIVDAVSTYALSFPAGSTERANVNAVASLIASATANARKIGWPSVSLIEVQQGQSKHFTEMVQMHEIGIHGWQRSIAGNGSLVDKGWLMRDPMGAALWSRITSKSAYSQGGFTVAEREALAYILSGDYARLGYSENNLPQLRDFVSRYLTEVARVHGVGAIESLTYYDPLFKPTVDAVIRQAGGRVSDVVPPKSPVSQEQSATEQPVTYSPERPRTQYRQFAEDNAEIIARLETMNLNTPRAQALIRELRDYAIREGIELRHFHHELARIRTDQADAAIEADNEAKYKARQAAQIADREATLQELARREQAADAQLKALSDADDAIARQVAAIDELFDITRIDPDMMALYDAAITGSNEDVEDFIYAAERAFGFDGDTARNLITGVRDDYRSRFPNRGGAAQTDRQASDTAPTQPAPTQPANNSAARSDQANGLTDRQRRLIALDPRNVSDKDFDRYLTALESLQNDAIHTSDFNGVDTAKREYNSIVGAIINAKKERSDRVEKDRLPALNESRNTPLPAGWKTTYGQKLVEQTAGKKTLSIVGQTINHRDEHLTGAEVVAESDDKSEVVVKTKTGDLVTIKHPDVNSAIKTEEPFAPADESQYIPVSEYNKAQRDTYFSEGTEKSSRTTPQTAAIPPLGSWLIDDKYKALDGRDIEQLVSLPVENIEVSEDTGPQKWDDVKQYAQWLKEGKEAPPIRLTQTDKGTLKTMDHRRLMAAKAAGQEEIKAWVSWATKSDRDGKPVVGLTYELAQKGNRPLPVTAAREDWKILPSDAKALKRIKSELADKPVTSPAPAQRGEEKRGEATGAKAATLADHFADAFNAGKSFGSITEARKSAAAYLGKEIKPGTIEAKQADESIELGVVLAARKIVAENRGNPDVTYDKLVDLYNRQPNLAVRTSTSVAQQAYSTPVPLAFVASHLAGITQKTSLYEPTAGNGALAIGADPKNVQANELNPDRAHALRQQGFDVTEENATTYRPKTEIDAVLANPPFGVVKDDNGKSVKYKPMAGFETTEIDHAIALKALESLEDNGRAVLILGGINKLAKTREARSDAYNGAAKRRFYYNLYNNYNVTDHFTVSGDLYAKQGAGWPVDVIVIEGRGKSSRALPAVDVPRIYESYASLKEVLNQAARPSDSVATAEQPGSRSNTGRTGTEARPGNLFDNAGGQSGRLDQGSRRPEGGGKGTAPTTGRSGVTGVSTEPAGTRNEQPGTTGATQSTQSVPEKGNGSQNGRPGRAPKSEGNQDAGVAGSRNGGQQQVKGLIRSKEEAWGDYRLRAELSGDTVTVVVEHRGSPFSASFPLSEYDGTGAFADRVLRATGAPLPSSKKPSQWDQLKARTVNVVYDVNNQAKALSAEQPAAEKPSGRTAELDKLFDDELDKAFPQETKPTNNSTPKSLHEKPPIASKEPQSDLFNEPDLKPISTAEFTEFEPDQQGAAFLEALKKGDTFKLYGNNAEYTVVSRTDKGLRIKKTAEGRPDKMLTIKRMGNVNYGNAGVENFFRDIEGQINLDLLNPDPRFHTPSFVTQKAREYLSGIREQKSQQPAKPKSVKEPVKKSAQESAQAFKDAAKGIFDLFSDPNKLSSGLSFDEKTYAKAKPHFEAAYEHLKSSVKNVQEAMAAFIAHLRDKMGMAMEAVRAMKPYVVQFIKEKTAEQSEETQPAKQEPAKNEPPPKREAKDTDTHRVYQPVSQARSVDTLVPVNMAMATRNALSNLEKRVGNLDEYVADKLGYDAKDIGNYFSGEQVDGLAQAIDNIERGAGAITGDATGVGKGRIVAGVIRYAIKNGKTPIFITEKPSLYGDMIRDLTDIGMPNAKPLITNANEAVPLDDEAFAWAAEADRARENGQKVPPRRGRFLQTAEGKKHQQLLSNATRNGLKASGHDAVFTTYNQMQKIKGESAMRHDLLDRLSHGAVVIFDESHNAGGGEPKINKEGEVVEDRAQFARKLARNASAVFYSSATYAKRPEVMDLYFKTDLSKAVSDIGELPGVLKRGGVPLQQVLASMLTEAGQYLRRERSFEGVEYDTQVAPVQKEAAESVASAMRGIVEFDRLKGAAVEQLAEDIKGQAQALGVDPALDVEGAKFSSLMHNVIDQMLLNLKVDAAAETAITALKNGEKPVITVANTMGAFLADFADQNDIKNGDPIKLDFGQVLHRYLERSRRVTIKNADKTIEHYMLTDADLGPAALEQYRAVEKLIEDSDWSKMPISPIDTIHQKIRAAGYKTAEITGRGQTIDYSGSVPVYRTRSASETSTLGKKKAINGFNDGTIDALIINQSGSTGISLHASEKFKNQNRRHMIIAQAEKNVDTHVQMLGRVHRTGQVIPPRYTQLAADIPSEKRPAAVLAKKMASLNANTTAARGSAVTATNVVDFLNEYGDRVAADLMNEDRDLYHRLGEPRIENDKGEVAEGAMRKITGRIPMLPLAEQEKVYDRLESDYNDLVERLDKMGANTLEAKTLDLRADTLSTEPLTEARGDSGMGVPANLEKVRVRQLGKPMTSAQVADLVGGALDEKTRDLDMLLALGDKAQKKLMQAVGQDDAAYSSAQAMRFDQQIADLQKKSEKMEEGKKKAAIIKKIEEAGLRKQQAATESTKQSLKWRTLANLLHPGAQILLKTDEGNLYGIVTDFSKRGDNQNPVALGGWRVNVAVADGARSITFPLSQVTTDSMKATDTHKAGMVAEYADSMPFFNSDTESFDYMPIPEAFDRGQSDSTELRHMVTGNVLAGFGELSGRGQIVNYTDKEGNVRQGVLMPRSWNKEKEMAKRVVVFETTDKAMEFLDSNGKIQTRDGDLVITKDPRRGGFTIAAASSKAKGGKYFLNKKILEAIGGRDFVKGGGLMRVSASDAEVRKVMDLLYSGEAMGQPTVLVAGSAVERARRERSQEAVRDEKPDEQPTKQRAYRRYRATVRVVMTYGATTNYVVGVVAVNKKYAAVAARVEAHKLYGETATRLRVEELVDQGPVILDHPAIRESSIAYHGNAIELEKWGVLRYPEDSKQEQRSREKSAFQPRSISDNQNFADAAQDVRIRQPKVASRANTIYANEQAHFFINRAEQQIQERDARETGREYQESDLKGANLSAAEAHEFADEIRKQKYWWKDEAPDTKAKADAAIESLAKAFEDTAGQYGRVLYVRGDQGFAPTRATVQHELSHNAERTYETSRGWFDAQPQAAKLTKVLKESGYSPDQYVHETVAHILGGQRAKLGLSLDEAENWLYDYASNITFREANGGRAAMESFNPLHTAPEMRPALREAKEKYGQRGNIRAGEKQVPGAIPAEGRSERSQSKRSDGENERSEGRNSAGRTAGAPQVATGTGRPKFSIGELKSEPRGQVAAAFPGNLQNLFNKPSTPKTPKAAVKYPLPPNWDMVKWGKKFKEDAFVASLSQLDRDAYQNPKTTAAAKKVILGRHTITPQKAAEMQALLSKMATATANADGGALHDAMKESKKFTVPPKTTKQKVVTNAADVANLPRAVMASADVSAPLRQGAILSLPPQYWFQAARAGLRMFQSFKTSQYEKIVKAINLQPNAHIGKEAGLYLSTDETGALRKTEEDFISGWTGHIPIVKHSEQAYKAYLDSIRIDTFSKYKKAIDKNTGLSAEEKQEAYKAAAEWINVATGRGSLGSTFEKAMPVLSKFLFAPRYAASRIQVLNPYTYAKNSTTPAGRAMLGRQMTDMMGYLGTVGVTMALAAAAGATVKMWPPDDPDWLKIRFGNYRYDGLAGLQQPARLFWRLGKDMVSAAKGEKPEGQNALEVTGRYLRSKLAPIPSWFTDAILRRDFTGKKFNPVSGAVERVVPLMWKDFYEAWKQEQSVGSAFLKVLPGAFGVGVQNYNEKPGTIGGKQTSFHQEAARHGLTYDYVAPIDKSEPEEMHRQRAEKIDSWLSQYGDNLIQHPRYAALTDDQQKAAIESLRARIGAQANLAKPDTKRFDPATIILSVKKSAAQQPKRDAKKIYVPESKQPTL